MKITGVLCLSEGDRKGGRKHVEEALKMAKSQKDTYSINMIGDNLKKIAKEDEALKKGGWLTPLK